MIATHCDTFTYGFFFGASWIAATGVCRIFWISVALVRAAFK